MRYAMQLCLITALAFAAFPTFALDVEGVKGKIAGGYHAMGHDGKINQVGEYESVSSGGDVEGDLEVLRDTAYGVMMLDAHACYWEEDDKNYAVDLDVARLLRFSYSYDEFLHRLRHDELFADEPKSEAGELTESFPPEGLTAYNPVYTAEGELHGAQTWKHEDLDVGRDYQILRSEEIFEVRASHPSVPGFQPFFRYRKEARRGFRQVTWMNGKCASCHVMGNGRRIDERTADYEVGFTYRWGLLSVDYRHLERRYDDHASPVYTTFDDAAKNSAVFTGRLQYTSADGTQPVAYRPSVDKHLDTARLHVQGLPLNSTFFLSYTASEVENTHGDEDLGYGGNKELKYQGVNARLTSSLLGHRLRLSLKARYFTLDNDDVYVTAHHSEAQPDFAASDPVYEEGQEFAFQRHSVANRNDWLVGLEASYRLATGWLLRGSYAHERKDRDYQQDYLLDEDTDIDRVEAELAVSRVPFLSKLRGRLAYRYESRQDPFENYQGICEEYRELEAKAPYYEVFRNQYRTQDASDVASDLHQVRLNLSYPCSESLSADFHLKYTNGDNADSGWEGRTVALGPTITFTPTRTLAFVAGYTYETSRYQTHYCVDLFGG